MIKTIEIEKAYTFLDEIKKDLRRQKSIQKSFSDAYIQTNKKVWLESYNECEIEIKRLESLLYHSILCNIVCCDNWSDKDIKEYIIHHAFHGS